MGYCRHAVAVGVAQMRTVVLPKEKIVEARDKVIASLSSGSRQEQQMAYLEIVETVSHPAAIFRGRCVKGTRRLQYFLNGIMAVRIIIYIVFFLLGIFLNKWWLLGLPLWLISDLWILNLLQTYINVQLMSRLIVLDNLMDENEDFRSQALATLGLLGEDMTIMKAIGVLLAKSIRPIAGFILALIAGVIGMSLKDECQNGNKIAIIVALILLVTFGGWAIYMVCRNDPKKADEKAKEALLKNI
jgi:hypothetical protein